MPAPCPKQRVAKPGGANRSTEIIYYILKNNKYYILIRNDFKVLILILLYKSNSSNLNINNIIIKLKIIINNQVFIFFN